MDPQNKGIRYNGNLVCTKISGPCNFSLIHVSHVILQENFFLYLLELPRQGDSNKYTKRMSHKETIQKYPLFMLKTGHYQVSL